MQPEYDTWYYFFELGIGLANEERGKFSSVMELVYAVTSANLISIEEMITDDSSRSQFKDYMHDTWNHLFELELD